MQRERGKEREEKKSEGKETLFPGVLMNIVVVYSD